MLSRTAFSWIASAWFISHIPITLFMDAQIVLPRSMFPVQAWEMCDWYQKSTHDPLVRSSPAWFRGLVWCELLLQLPFFFAATYAYTKSIAQTDYDYSWIQVPSIAYGAHTCTTLVPILMEMWHSPSVPTIFHRKLLTAIYMPYLLFPMLIGAYEFIRLPQPKTTSVKAKRP
mmetsp:Transcript_29028/g.55700  ORF Transcript_29028/g.55700 Transcript_29028/m.55700 type:complete len:172 (+) Transcript_29028:14-529(+)